MLRSERHKFRVHTILKLSGPSGMSCRGRPCSIAQWTLRAALLSVFIEMMAQDIGAVQDYLTGTDRLLTSTFSTGLTAAQIRIWFVMPEKTIWRWQLGASRAFSIAALKKGLEIFSTINSRFNKAEHIAFREER
jgi:hypothetical protein